MMYDSAQLITLDKIEESHFTEDHPEVIKWTQRFRELAKVGSIFHSVETALRDRPTRAQLCIGAGWYEFTNSVPWMLCFLASKSEGNLARHFLIQTAFEELGGRNRNAIHSDLYMSALQRIGMDEGTVKEYIEVNVPLFALEKLKKSTHAVKGNPEIMGLCLGLELPANENISTILAGLGTNEELQATLLKTPFFKIHRLVEDEHIRLSVSNFLQFCQGDQEKDKFLKGFEGGITFWKEFWSEVTSRIVRPL